MISSTVKESFLNGKYDDSLQRLYVCTADDFPAYRSRFAKAIASFEDLYGANREISVFSAPGRTEIGGNHTDHQRGRVLAASVNLDVIAIAAPNGTNTVRVHSEGYPEDCVSLMQLMPLAEEINHSAALIRGICARFKEFGYPVQGFDAYTTSNVLSGSGLSSSAAFEVLIGTIVNHLFCEEKETALSVAQIGQSAENRYFGKPCGLMDQAASSVGGCIQIDFANKESPQIIPVPFDFTKSGHALCIIDTKCSHNDLTPDYAAIPQEMSAVAAYFGKEVLREVDELEFYQQITALRNATNDRAVLRAIHFFTDNAHVLQETAALEQNDFERFKHLIRASGISSSQYLQNIYSSSQPLQQGVSIVLALCQRYLEPVGGAWRIHGGGFAGTVQAFVPLDYMDEFTHNMELTLGKGTCHNLRIRPVGGFCVVK